MNPYLKLLRISHWVKNLLVFTGIFFAGKFFSEDLFTVLLMFLAFCLASSFVYILNDIKDHKMDSLHPAKKKRPIPSGKISLSQAKTFLGIIGVLIIIFMTFIPILGTAVLLSYLVLNLLYIFYFKNIPIVDIFSISLGYIFRVLAGTISISLDTSLWLLVTVLTLSLFLASTKRVHELAHKSHKSVLKYYDKELLNDLVNVTITLSLVFYTTYVILEKNNMWSFAGLFIVYLGIFKYLLAFKTSKNSHDPIKLFFKDKWLMIIFSLWGLVQLIGLYIL